MTERWLPVVGYERLYEVSDLGRIRSLDRVTRTNQFRVGKVLACSIDRASTGYRYARLSKDGVCVKVNIHVLVLTAFVGPRPSPRHEACHDDGDRTNAALSNLRWDTPEANHADRIRHGTDIRGERAPAAVLSSELVQWIRESPQSSLRLAPILGVASSTIRAVRSRQNWWHL